MNKYVIAALAILLACVTCFGSGYYTSHLRSAERIAGYKVAIGMYISANDSLQDTVAKLRVANQAFQDAATISADRAAKAQADVDALRQQSDDALRAAQAKLSEASHATPKARSWAVVPVPAGIADELRH